MAPLLPKPFLTWISLLLIVPLILSGSRPQCTFAKADSVLSFSDALGKLNNVTVYQNLTKIYPSTFLQLLNASSTVIVPNDAAFAKVGSWHADNSTQAIPLIQYSIIPRQVSMASITRGDMTFEHTQLVSPAISNVTGGQIMMFTKQPNDDVVITSGAATRSTVVLPDIAFDGGLIQVVDSLINVPEGLESIARGAYTDLEAFLGALYATDLVAEFTETPNITIFAPNNAAFQQLAGTLQSMDKATLTEILRYHMVPGQVGYTIGYVNGTKMPTAVDGGKDISITSFNNYIYINSAQIVQTDILIANGVVQMIDNVLNPEKSNALPNVTASAQTPVFQLTGSTTTGSAVATPFVTYLPCTSCTSATDKANPTAGGSSKSSSSQNVAGSLAQCTGLPVVAGIGIGVAVGVLGMDLIGVA